MLPRPTANLERAPQHGSQIVRGTGTLPPMRRRMALCSALPLAETATPGQSPAPVDNLDTAFEENRVVDTCS